MKKKLTFIKIPHPQWVVYLVGLLSTDVANLIAKESSADAQNYDKIKHLLLNCFKFSAEKFWQKFS